MPAQQSGKAAPDKDLQELAGVMRATIIPLARLLRHGDFTPTQSSIIGSIDRLQPVTMGDLAAVEKLSLPVVSRIVRRLEETGVVVRSVREDDRRAQWISLSEHFTAEIRLNRADRNRQLAAVLATFGAEDVAILAAAVPLLQRLMAAQSED